MGWFPQRPTRPAGSTSSTELFISPHSWTMSTTSTHRGPGWLSRPCGVDNDLCDKVERGERYQLVRQPQPFARNNYGS
jgi:hypothetical protein